MNSSGPTDCERPTSCPTTYRRSESLKAHRWNEQITKTGGTYDLMKSYILGVDLGRLLSLGSRLVPNVFLTKMGEYTFCAQMEGR